MKKGRRISVLLRIFAVMLCMALLFAPLAALAHGETADVQSSDESATDEQEPATGDKPESNSPETPLMGDLNGDGRITASDARTALRISSRLEQRDDIGILSTDANGDGKLTASDARAILRVAARLSGFSTGFDKNGNLNALNAVRSGTYSVSAVIESVEITIIKDGDNIIFRGFDMEGLAMQNLGLMLTNGSVYMLWSDDNNDYLMYLSDEFLGNMGLSTDDVLQMSNMLEEMLPDELSGPTKVTVNSQERLSYTGVKLGADITLLTTVGGKLVSLDDGVISTVITDFSADVSKEQFDVSNYYDIDNPPA